MVTKFGHVLLRGRFLTLALTGLACVFPLSVDAADKGSPPAYDQSDTTPDLHKNAVGRHVEGHIAFLRAELNITPAQEELWEAVAAAMREDVKEMQDTERSVSRQMLGRETAIQYLQNRVLFANLRAQDEARFLAALKPLYESLSEKQKQLADDLLVSTSSDQ